MIDSVVTSGRCDQKLKGGYMGKEADIELLMDSWEEKHRNKGYKRFIRDGIVCEEEWEKQQTPKVCYFLKEAYTSNENGYNLVEDLHDCEQPWTMWRKIAIWTQAIHNAFSQNMCEYDEEILRSHEKEIIDRIAVVNVKKSKVVNFRVDRIAGKPDILDKDVIPMPDDFDIENFTKEVFFMFPGEKVIVDLRCDNSLM